MPRQAIAVIMGHLGSMSTGLTQMGRGMASKHFAQEQAMPEKNPAVMGMCGMNTQPLAAQETHAQKAPVM